MDNEQEKPESQNTEPTTPKPASPPKIVDIRGELDITIYKPITKETEDVYTQGELMVSLSIDGQSKQGLVVLSIKKTKQLLKLLNLEGV